MRTRGNRHDLIEHAVHIGFEVDVPDAKDLITEPIEMLRSQAIQFDRSWVRMLRAVELHDELRGFAKKVSDVRTTGRLSPKFQSIEAAVAQPRPEAAFVLGLIAAQKARVLCKPAHHCACGKPPHPNPLPKGRGNVPARRR